MSFLPEGIEIPAWIVYTAIYFGLGLLIGLAVKKALAAAILIIIAAVIAVFLLGFSIAIDVGGVATSVWDRIANFYSTYGIALSSYPVAFIVGALLGFWKGR